MLGGVGQPTDLFTSYWIVILALAFLLAAAHVLGKRVPKGVRAGA